MKNGIKILLSMFALLAISCGNSTKQAGTDGTSDTYYSSDAQGMDHMNGDDNMNSNSSMMNNEATNTPTQDLTQEEYDKQRNTQMYTSLNMTDEQIGEYESVTRSSMDTWKRDNPQKTMATQDRMKYQSDHLKTILDESQYTNYGQWATSNPYRN
ncbi:hypothetical protein CSW08_09920 [Confluentibacter flavum]|uniref:Lipoprotein n=2 Tax=Confluentibacter flavum TaxID=1909700 RepID=A0A2N3HJD2_9FLAO|nr:hypothetical protein CSW08_09920 [Confluentibacter flavum]